MTSDLNKLPFLSEGKFEILSPVIFNDSLEFAAEKGFCVDSDPRYGLLAKQDLRTAVSSMSNYVKSENPEQKDYDTSQPMHETMYLAYAQPPGFPNSHVNTSVYASRDTNQVAYDASALLPHRTTYEETSTSFTDPESSQYPQVTSYAPHHGPQGTQVFIYFYSSYDTTALPGWTYSMMFAGQPCHSTLTRLNSAGDYHNYVLTADAPAFGTTRWLDSCVPLRVQIHDNTGAEVKTIEVGQYTFTDATSPTAQVSLPGDGLRKRKISDGTVESVKVPAKRVSHQSLRTSDEGAGSRDTPSYGHQPSPMYTPARQSFGEERSPTVALPYAQSPSIALYQQQQQSTSQQQHLQHPQPSVPSQQQRSRNPQAPSQPQWLQQPQQRMQQMNYPQQSQQRQQQQQQQQPLSPRSRGSQQNLPTNSTNAQSTRRPLSPQTPLWSPMHSTMSQTSHPSHSPNITVAPAHKTTSVASMSKSLHPPLIRSSTLQQPAIPAGTADPNPFNPYRMYPHKAVLKIEGSLDDMATGWTEDETSTKRRLVQFWRSQNNNTISTNFKPVAPEDRQPNSICISCIQWESKRECYVTSVDTIYLLESLVAVRFTVEEKNRIRRNLEGFKPLTVSKGKPDSEDFFKLIMSFPNPKPRNIEKDVKVFPWKILSHALKKIIGKYVSRGPLAPPQTQAHAAHYSQSMPFYGSASNLLQSASYSSTAGELTHHHPHALQNAYGSGMGMAHPGRGSSEHLPLISPHSASAQPGYASYSSATAPTSIISPHGAHGHGLSLAHSQGGPSVLPASIPSSLSQHHSYPTEQQATTPYGYASHMTGPSSAGGMSMHQSFTQNSNHHEQDQQQQQQPPQQQRSSWDFNTYLESATVPSSTGGSSVSQAIFYPRGDELGMGQGGDGATTASDQDVSTGASGAAAQYQMIQTSSGH
ncbi:hypothetical protein MMC25_005794 [Agyrium rufum]|nr:hypothetical protein [Agyrium rufum]